MTIAVASKLLSAGLLVWFGLLLMMIAGRVISGDIHSDGMLTEATGTGDTPERMLLMAVGPALLVMYALSALNSDILTTRRLPDVPEAFTAILTGTNGLFLAVASATPCERRWTPSGLGEGSSARSCTPSSTGIAVEI